MASEAHESIKLVNFCIVDSTVNTIYTLKHKWDAHEFRVFRRTLKYFALNNCKIPSFNC